jgi:hypothetical protein
MAETPSEIDILLCEYEKCKAEQMVRITDATKDSSFIDGVIDKAMAKRAGVVHVKGHSKSLIPSKISAYRMRSITWRELEAIFK